MPRYVVRGQRVTRSYLELARQLRQQMTSAERILWDAIRANRLRGLRFRRQQVIGGYIADFYCDSVGLAIEVDGAIHDTHVDYDRVRDEFIATYGVSILRFKNDEVLNDLDSVLRKIETVIDNLSDPALSPTERTLRQ